MNTLSVKLELSTVEVSFDECWCRNIIISTVSIRTKNNIGIEDGTIFYSFGHLISRSSEFQNRTDTVSPVIVGKALKKKTMKVAKISIAICKSKFTYKQTICSMLNDRTYLYLFYFVIFNREPLNRSKCVCECVHSYDMTTTLPYEYAYSHTHFGATHRKVNG